MVNGMSLNLDFQSSDNIYLFSDKLEEQIKKYDLFNQLKKLNLSSHIFILSSGTTQKSGLKGYALAKEAILANAKGVNEHLKLTKNDTWLVSLPHYHIGGLSIYARSFLSGANIKEYHDKWSVSNFLAALKDVSIVSVVPTQCYDLVNEKQVAPKNLRYLLVGGDYLNDSLHKDLIDLGWPVIRTFGMTEVSSQLATEKIVSNDLQLEILNIHEVKTAADDRLQIKSPSLFTGIFQANDNGFVYTPREYEFYQSQDRVDLQNNTLIPKGRLDDEVKIKGRRVDLFEMNKLFKELFYQLEITQSAQYKIIKDLRDGFTIEIHSLFELPDDIRKRINGALKPLSINKYKVIPHLNRTELGKDKN